MIKKVFFALLALIMLGIGTAQATDYNVTVAGVQVTSDNMANITGTGISGVVTYNPTTNTLYLNNATISTSDWGIRQSAGTDTFRIVLTGNNVITSNKDAIANAYSVTTIDGPGSLALNCSSTSSYDGIWLYTRNLIIRNCNISIIAGYRAIAGNSSTLYITNSTMKLYNADTNFSPITGLTSVYFMDNCGIKSPANAYYSSTSKNIVNNAGDTIHDTVFIEPYFDIAILGNYIYKSDTTNISYDGISGTINYYPSEEKLSLDNVTILDTISELPIYANDDCHIELVGNNTIVNNTGYASIDFEYDGAIYGQGSLTIISDTAAEIETDAINFFGDYLLINDCELNIFGSYDALYGEDAGLYITNAKIIAHTTKTSYSAIRNFGDVSFDNSALIKPVGATYNTSTQQFEVGGTVTNDTIVIVRGYNINVGNTLVHEGNASNITSSEINGSISYNPTTKTLTMNNANITSDALGIELSTDDDITLELVGLNSITSTDEEGIVNHSKKGTCLTIQGNGSLTMTSTNSMGIYSNLTNLTIQNCTLNITANSWGIAGNCADTNENLVINNATIHVTSSTKSTIADYNTFTLNGCAITAPADACWNGTDHFVTTTADTTTAYIGTIVIEPTQGIASAENADFRVYPNPASNNVTLASNANINMVEVYNTNGAVVMTQNTNSANVTINISELSNGIYAVKVYTEKGMAVRRLIVKR